MKIWNDKLIARLKELHGQKHSQSTIGIMMGMSTASIASAIRRYIKVKPVKYMKPIVYAKTQFVSKKPEASTLYGTPPKSLGDVDKNECRWMVGDLCCAAPCNKRYCEIHEKVSRGN